MIILLIALMVISVGLFSGCLGKKECSHCGGIGICSTCQGSGNDLVEGDLVEDCADCDGTGWCSNCGGTGEV